MTDRGEQLRLRLVGSLCRLTRLALRLKALDGTLYLPKTGREREDPELASPVMAPDIPNRIGSLADIHLKLG